MHFCIHNSADHVLQGVRNVHVLVSTICHAWPTMTLSKLICGVGDDSHAAHRR